MKELLKIHNCETIRELAEKIVETVYKTEDDYEAIECVEDILNGKEPSIND